ncbi:MAG: hypothetical protein RL215_3097 [Planctomycetota bacterium]|jgi:hypothetical protein
MPNLLLLTLSFAAAAVFSAVFAGLMHRLPLRRNEVEAAGASGASSPQALLVLGGGVVAGLAVQRSFPSIPPSSGLDRFLTLIFPALLAAEFLAACGGVRGRYLNVLRILLCLAVPVVILFDSTHLHSPPDWFLLPGLTGGGGLRLLGCSLLIALFDRLVQRRLVDTPGLLALACLLSLQSAGIAVMLGGWIRGGSAALPLAGASAGVCLAGGLFRQQSLTGAAARMAVWSLLNMLLLGHFFGRLSLADTAWLMSAVLLPPWVPLPLALRRRIHEATFQLGLTATVLAVLLWLWWRTFALRMQPLLANLGN